ncbi:MAG: sulfite exporter TauE/SafE family protein [Ilumatobacter sp.]|nr:sulfite exporter TauE/SafE family protein [Ilumatobacter sp.]
MTTGQLAIVLAAVVVGSIAKAVTGMGLPVIVIPIAALFVDIGDAVVVIALPNMVANAMLAAHERHHVRDTRDLPVLATVGIVGAIAGTLLFVSVPDEPLVVALLVAIAGYITMFFLKPDLVTSPAQSRRWSPVVGATAGAFQGAIGISGPIVGSWIHSYRLPRGAHILSVTVLFLITGATQFVVLLLHGELDGRVTATLLACIPVAASIPFGRRLRDRFSIRGFDLAIVGMLALSSVALCIRTFA